MNKTVFTGQNICFGIIILIGSVLFLWFLWPAVFKGIVNTGNLCGLTGSALLVFYGIRHSAIHRFLAELWQTKTGRTVLLLLGAAVFSAVILMTASAAAILRAASADIPKNTPAVVLGCSVKGSRPSRVLRERIDAAYAYMQEHPKAVCVLSGGKGRGEDISEAECMYRELTEAGIADGRLYIEAESTNTQENLENSKAVLEGAGITGAVTVISSEFHLYRGRQWAKKTGYEDYGYAAHTDWKYLPTYFLREVVAVVHMWLF